MTDARTLNPREEGRLLLRSFAKGLPQVIDAQEAILSMKVGGSRNWRQMEWIGFYPEYWFETNLAVELSAQTGPKFGNTTFDIQRNHVWDLKAHATGKSSWAPLNDIQAVKECISHHGGVGFLVLSGPCTYDEDGSFKVWHENLNGGRSEYSITIEKRGAKSRRRKTSFQPDHLIAFRFESFEELSQARREGWLKGFQEGMRNSNDSARRAKIMVDVDEIAPWAVIEDIRR